MIAGHYATALIASHFVLDLFVLDLFSGHPHNFFGENTQPVGLGLYATNASRRVCRLRSSNNLFSKSVI